MPPISLSDVKEEYRSRPGAAALVSLINRCRSISGGTAPLLSFLRAIYNGGRDPVDLELLIKRVDPQAFTEVVQVMTFYRQIWDSPRIEIHRVFIDERTFEVRLFHYYEDAVRDT